MLEDTQSKDLSLENEGFFPSNFRLRDCFRTLEIPITLSEKVFAVATRCLQVVAILATATGLALLEFTANKDLAFGSFMLGLTLFSAYFSLDKSFYSFVERREMYHDKLGKMPLLEYFNTHGFERIFQYGFKFEGPSPLITKEEFTSYFRTAHFQFEDSKVREFICKCTQEGILSNSDREHVEEQFLTQVETFEEAIDKGLFDLIGLGFFEGSEPLMRIIYSPKSWERIDLLFKHFELIKKAALLPRRLPGLASALVDQSSEHATFKNQLKAAFKKGQKHFESELKHLEKEEKELAQKASSGHFLAHPEEIRKLDHSGLLKEGFDTVDFYAVIRAHTIKQREHATNTHNQTVQSLQTQWKEHLKSQIQALQSYKDLAEIAFSFDKMDLETFFSTYGFERVSKLMHDPNFALSKEEISVRLFHDYKERSKLLSSDLTHRLMESHLLSDQAKLAVEKLLLQPGKFNVIASEGYIFKFLDRKCLSKNTLGRIEALVSHAIVSGSGSELLAFWRKIRSYKLATNPELEPLYAWLSSQEKNRTQTDEEYQRLKQKLGVVNEAAYPIKKHPYGNVKLNDDRNFLIFT